MDNSFLHSKRLLLVDDEQELLKMVSDILKDAGFETVLTAMSVKKAILTAKEEPIFHFSQPYRRNLLFRRITPPAFLLSVPDLRLERNLKCS